MNSKENVKEAPHRYASAKPGEPRLIEVLVGSPGPLFIDGREVGYLEPWDNVTFTYQDREIVSFKIEKGEPFGYGLTGRWTFG